MMGNQTRIPLNPNKMSPQFDCVWPDPQNATTTSTQPNRYKGRCEVSLSYYSYISLQILQKHDHVNKWLGYLPGPSKQRFLTLNGKYFCIEESAISKMTLYSLLLLWNGFIIYRKIYIFKMGEIYHTSKKWRYLSPRATITKY